MITWAADVGNAYLESYTKEKVYIVAGPEFNELQGCILVIARQGPVWLEIIRTTMA